MYTWICFCIYSKICGHDFFLRFWYVYCLIQTNVLFTVLFSCLLYFGLLCFQMIIEYFFLLKIINNKNECLFLCDFLLVITIVDVTIYSCSFFNRLLTCTCSVICWLCYLSGFLLGFTAINIKLKFYFYFKNVKFCL